MYSLRSNQRNSFLIERNKCLPAKPFPLVRNQSVRKIPTSVQNSQPRIGSRTINHDIAGLKQSIERARNILLPKTINTTQHPDKLAKTRQRNSNHFSTLEQLGGGPGLLFIVPHYGANENVRVDDNSHFRFGVRPAHPASAAS